MTWFMIRYGSLHLEMNANNFSFAQFVLFFHVYFWNDDKIVPQASKQWGREMTLSLFLAARFLFAFSLFFSNFFFIFALFFFRYSFESPYPLSRYLRWKLALVIERPTEKLHATKKRVWRLLMFDQNILGEYQHWMCVKISLRTRSHREIMSDIFIASVSSIEIYLWPFFYLSNFWTQPKKRQKKCLRSFVNTIFAVILICSLSLWCYFPQVHGGARLR